MIRYMDVLKIDNRFLISQIFSGAEVKKLS